MSINLKVKMVQASETIEVSSDASATVEELKEQIASRASLPKDHIRLVCAGRIWQDACTVASYEPKEGATVHCLGNPPRAPAPTAAEQTLTPTSPLQSLMGAGAGVAGAGAGSGDPMAQMMAQSQQMMAQNPEMLTQLMDSPIMQQIMSNPEMMRMMMRMNPQMNELMEQRPEIARMLEDPEVLRQSMQMMRNPSLMREMQRNADLQMGRLDVMPGGHAALMRAHDDVVNPVMNAFSGGQDGADADIPEYAQQAQGAPNAAALPNAWGAPAAAPALAAAPAAVAPSAAPATAAPAAPAGGAGASPMAAMMHQMMANPEAMQQSMQMAQQMFGGGAVAATAVPETSAMEQLVGTPPASGALAGADANPMASFRQQMVQQMMSDPGMMQASMQMAAQMFGGAQQAGGESAAPGAPNPMAAMMQQAMASPEAMQQSIQMAQQMFGGAQQAGGESAAPDAPNPMAAMMQQMMANPEMMQQSMQMAQQMFGAQQASPAPRAPSPMAAMLQHMMADAPAGGADQAAPAADAALNPTVRARFAAQLSQLSVMGFVNEEACLRALLQHQGRLDAAIDLLLSSGEGSM